jgi:hypothetical protein
VSTIDIFYSARPKRGKYIADGKHGFGIVDDAPAMRCRWHGGLLPTGDQVFHFQTQTEIFAFLDSKSMEGMAKWSRKDIPYLGLLPSLAVAGWQAATTKIQGMQAFAVSYRNPQGHVGLFLALAPTDVVDQIAVCLPPDKVKDPDNVKDKPKEL